MPSHALSHGETFAGPDLNHPPNEGGIAGSARVDPLQQFSPEEPPLLKSQAIAREAVAGELRLEGSNPMRDSLPRSSGARLPAWMAAIGSVPVPGVRVPLSSFIFGIALGAFAMWLLAMQPELFNRLRQPAASKEGSTSIPAAVAPAAPLAGAPATRDVNVPPSTRVETGQNDQAGLPAASPQIAPGIPPATGSSTASDVAPAEPTTPARTGSAAVVPVRPAAFRGSLMVRSDPPGARVFVRDQAVGVTPIELKRLPIGSRAVRIEADGYDPWSAAVRVVADQQTQVTARLDRATSARRP